MIQASQRQKVYLKDYLKPLFNILTTDLVFNIYENQTQVENTMQIECLGTSDLILNGVNLRLLNLKINNQVLFPNEYKLNDEYLTIKSEFINKFKNSENQISLEIITEIHPNENTSLEGLYKSGTGFCTQCEPEGFRKITYFIDRPDVMSIFKCTINADKSKFPILLSNGNQVTKKDLGDGRHQVIWEDPFRKPCYLFALVAGDYGCIRDEFTTHTNRKILLELYSPHGTQDRARFALNCLKKSMRWDEEHYGREYDLDRYMILSVDDFNAGAMENKGLNIFNSKFIMASPETATDDDYEDVDSVIAHEYFHNWTGNRITLRDWFHLSLKEGLTVFRDQQYTEDQTSASVKRIDDIQRLRSAQFAEDAGPNAHPVRPESCYSVDNFFSTTIYEKGAEVIRMISILLGKEQFRKGMDYYFEHFDGQAVTIENFVSSFEKTSNVDLTHFRKWYSQSGTPEIVVDEEFNEDSKTYKMKLTQHTNTTHDQDIKEPLLIPIRCAFYDNQGHKLDMSALKFTFNENNFKSSFSNFHLKSNHEGIIVLQSKEQALEITSISSKPIPSLLRHFSAPVNLKGVENTDELLLLSQYDDDGFNRWEAFQKIILNSILDSYKKLVLNPSNKSKLDFSVIGKVYKTIFAQVLKTLDSNKHYLTKNNFAYKSKLLSFPNIKYVLQSIDVVSPLVLIDVYNELSLYIIKEFKSEIYKIYNLLPDIEDLTYASISIRKLKRNLLNIIGYDPDSTAFIFDIFKNAKNMSQQWGAFEALNSNESKERTLAGQLFKEKWKNDALVLNKYYIWESSFSEFTNFINYIESLDFLMKEEYFNLTNPNNVRSIIGGFASYNYRAFHYVDEKGEAVGYKWFSNQLIEVDKLNPQTAARLSSYFDIYPRLEPKRKILMKTELDRILNLPGLSKNTYEIINNTIR